MADIAGAIAAVAGIAGALGGVALGGWLSARNQRQMLTETHRRAERQARVDASVEFLSVYRQFRVYVLTEDPEVIIPAGRPPGNEFGFVRGDRSYSDATQAAVARLMVLEPEGSAVLAAVTGVQASLRHLALARARQGPGALPDDLVDSARAAEREFARAVQRELAVEVR